MELFGFYNTVHQIRSLKCHRLYLVSSLSISLNLQWLEWLVVVVEKWTIADALALFSVYLVPYHTTRDGSDIENGLAGKAEVRQSAGDLEAKTTELTDLKIVKAWPSNQNPKRFLNPFDQIDLSLPKIGKRWNEFFEKWTSL